MRPDRLIALAIAITASVIAMGAAKKWLDVASYEQAERLIRALPRPPVEETPAMKLTTVVAAASELRFGEDLNRYNLQEIPWPANAVPAGAFRKIDELLSGTTRRVVLSYIDANEPILSNKITGPGQRATLSAMLRPGMKAVTVKVNDVIGVGGFVLPGDNVDILMTRDTMKRDATREVHEAYTEILLQDVRVLAVHQQADDRVTKPNVARTVTLEVNTRDSQKLALASSVASLSLALRDINAVEAEIAPQRVTLADLTGDNSASSTQLAIAGVADAAANRGTLDGDVARKSAIISDRVVVSVLKAVDRREYSVVRR